MRVGRAESAPLVASGVEKARAAAFADAVRSAAASEPIATVSATPPASTCTFIDGVTETPRILTDDRTRAAIDDRSPTEHCNICAGREKWGIGGLPFRPGPVPHHADAGRERGAGQL